MSDKNTEALDDLVDRLCRDGEAVNQKAAEMNILGAFEHAEVAATVARVARNTPKEELTTERLELASRLSWALCELETGGGTRVRDDLNGVEQLASEVSESATHD